MKWREEPMDEQNRLNEEKGRSTQRKETKKVTGREKVGNGAIRKITHGEIATKPK